jgi:hypothetical protein
MGVAASYGLACLRVHKLDFSHSGCIANRIG